MSENTASKTENLIHAVLHPEDYRDASSALIELKKLNPSLARDMARAVLTNESEEVHYRAFAMHILHTLSREEALRYISRRAGSEDIYVVAAMIDSVADDAVYEHEGDSIYKEAVRSLARSLKARPEVELKRVADKVSEFKKVFPDEF
jgi:hypothetical protein